MKYDGQKLTAPNSPHDIVAVWDCTSKNNWTGETRWLCKAADGQLYLYWCLEDRGFGRVIDAGTWLAVDSPTWSDLARDYPPVWSCSDDPIAVSEKCACDLYQLMRGDGHNAGCTDTV